ncbi:AfsR/SARP family transcriptional regulator [Actinoallomurus purpureus]|uniref:AfsR/SARP family transcriptional regulator n=1 Tax=Actinoallomurus purpureus TaxID=478114 RepID=UPI0020937415|nr:AfsR/SARP family transcriptional regulator [Actinoallomurus purpureus]MCO6011010.1 AfsR/SARP family transcriptional regulator [Actinoallomurus purpureus]
MEIRILGPLTLSHEGRPLTVTAPKPRKVLTLLLLNAGFIVPTRALMTEVWGEHSPRSASTTLQTYILQLRRSLGAVLDLPAPAVAKKVLITCESGYMIRTADTEFDLPEYESIAQEGRLAFSAGDYAEAARLIGEALDLWRGPALVDVAAGRLIETEILRLEESRLSLLELRIETNLRLGRHHEILSELTALVARHPLHEELHGKFMLALYRSGRRSQALEVFHQLRSTLIRELGLDPTPSLQRLQQRILSSDPTLDVPPQPEHRPLEATSAPDR